ELVPWSMARRMPLVAWSSRMLCSGVPKRLCYSESMGASSMLAALLPALVLANTAPANLGVLHQYASVALNADGKLIASVETVRQAYATTEQHGAVVIRNTAGTITATLDPCTKCKYADVAWSSEGAQLAFTASADGAATLYVATLNPAQKEPVVPNKLVE